MIQALLKTEGNQLGVKSEGRDFAFKIKSSVGWNYSYRELQGKKYGWVPLKINLEIKPPALLKYCKKLTKGKSNHDKTKDALLFICIFSKNIFKWNVNHHQ